MSSTINRRFLDVSMSVLGVVNEPPATPEPVNGTQYIVGSAPAGAFASAVAGSLARYDGYAKAWKFTKPALGQMEVLNVATGEFIAWDGTDWTIVASIGEGEGGEPPVLGIVPSGTALPATAAVGDKFLNTQDKKLYTATAANTWDAGVTVPNGGRYASATDKKIYEMADGELTGKKPADGAMFLNKADGDVYLYHGEDDRFDKVGVKTVVETETHVLTEAEVTAKKFELSKAVAAGKETSTLLSVCGVIQVAGEDFTVSGKEVGWDGKGLEDIVQAGDVFIVSYPTLR